MLPIEVRITKDATKFVPSQDPVTLSKSNGHVVQWHNDTNEQITIKFGAGTPFPSHMNPYIVSPGKFQQSGLIEGTAGKWKYNIEGASGTITDPDVVIEP
jgi:hypothetical protein